MSSEQTRPSTSGVRLQFTHQDYQARAVQAVVQAFDGQPMANTAFSLQQSPGSVEYATDGSIANRLWIAEAQMLENVRKVQAANGIEPTTELAADRAEKGENPGAFCPHFTLEMETGTGKTYTFIKTMYELNKVYGFKKFVIVVPSVAIREGTMKNLAITRQHFAQDYDNVPCVPILYNRDRLSELRHFAQSDALSVLVINIDSFARDGTKINQQGERAFAPIEYIRAVNPIVIVDEPQNFETDIRQRALRDLNPLCTLRYSATHKNAYNRLYSLNPVQAYDLGLVKQIEVDGIEGQDGHNQAFVELVKIEPKAKSMTARVRMDVNGANGVLRKEVSIKPGDDLHEKSKGRDVYQQGYVLNDIRGDEIEFSGGRVLRVGQRQDALQDAVQRYQMERTIAAHFAKLKQLQPLGIKVLSLFFIDKVAHYRQYDADGQPQPGKFAQWFEDIFTQYARKYPDLIVQPASQVHNGYFSGDRKGKGSKAQTIWKDTGGHTAKDDDTYALIMRDKERLLSLDEPLQFIFSHSALREGWDNPNVFQICTLNDTQSTLKKRQEIGRGLRLCVNAQGERVHDKAINVLTVVANESYESFARQLQAEIEEDTGASFAGRTKNARAKVRVARKELNPEEQALFEAIWQKINYQTRYSVKLDSKRLIADCIKALGDSQQYPPVQRPQVQASKAKIVMDAQGISGVLSGTGQHEVRLPAVVPDVYAYIQSRVHISRASVFAILDGCGRLDELVLNPQAFLDMAVQAMRNTLQALQVEGIEYREINGRRYEMTLFEPVETYLSSVYPPGPDARTPPLHKTLMQAQPLQAPGKAPAFDCVPSDSEVESCFARDCALDARVRFFFKLPGAFKIDTPLGRYNPDWAVVFEDDRRVYFVAETKSSLVDGALRRNETLKIECGKKHFAARGDDGQVMFKAVDGLSKLLG
nr:DEAD/DEAH box helicase family protein [Vandammella animalimorsus]